MTKPKSKFELINRELSWLSFNERVLQEAADKSNPIIERFRFLGIFSNNLDEFFKVRVASVRRLTHLNKKLRSKLGFDPNQLLIEIQTKVLDLQKQFDNVNSLVLRDALKEGISIVNEKNLSKIQEQQVEDYFISIVQSALVPIMLNERGKFPDLKDGGIYLAVKMYNDNDRKIQYALIEIPTDVVSRFLVLEKSRNKHSIILLDDIIRFNLRKVFSIFDYDNIDAYNIKITRDAELDIDDDISKGVVDLLSKSLKSRKKGDPVRFVHDAGISKGLRKFLLKGMNIAEQDNVIAGGRYHNYRDFIKFPSLGVKEFENDPKPPLQHRLLLSNRKLLDQIKKHDILLNYPYHSFNYVIDLLREAAIDPTVTSIKINIYRVAKNSKIINALINAVRNGKSVTAVLELRARFDEENNIYWSNKLQEEGVKVIFGVPGLKVHSKLILINRKERNRSVYYAHIGTGNFHEGTAGLYTDTSLLTADKRIANEVARVFDFFKSNYKSKRYSHLIISPYGSRRKFIELVNNEISNFKKDKKAGITIKLNNLVDEELIRKLYEASNAGVQIRLIIRGVCCLVPGVKGMSENIKVISIVGRFLEHSRIIMFENDGDPKIYISSADWMKRNLDGRIEVTTPIYDKKLKQTLIEYLAIQDSDNTKARILDLKQKNKHVLREGKQINAQDELYKYFSAEVKDVKN